MQINRVELEYNYCEVETNKKTTEAIDSVVAAAADTAGDAEHVSEDMLKLCTAVKQAFDHIFGDGTGEKVCGEMNDLVVCIDAISDLTKEINVQKEKLNSAVERFNGLFSEEA